MADTGPPLHEAVEPLRFLLGTWRGAGVGSYPTIDDFRYVEEITFGHVGKPFLAYGQKTRHAETDLPLHAESGYWRPVGGGLAPGVEVVLAHPTGLLESLAGSFQPGDGGGTLDLRCQTVVGTATAVEVVETTRRFVVHGDTLTYDVAMAAAGQPLTHHLSAELHRVE
ncbi:MAG: FABP family protein [Actinomycetota bacterium]